MHSRQASVLSKAQRVVARLEGRIAKGAPILWVYEDTTGDSPKTFYLEEKKTTVRSPFTGKTFTAKPKRHNLAQIGKEMKEESKEEGNELSLDPSKFASSKPFVNPFEE